MGSLGRRLLLAAGAVLVVGLWGFVQAASGTQLVIPQGDQAKVTNVKWAGCNGLELWYEASGVAHQLESFPGGCGEASGADATIGPYGGQQSLLLILEDRTCGFAFFSDGSEGSEGHVKITGTTPYLVKLRDGGGFCEYEPGEPIPPSEGANLEATVTMEPASVGPPEFGRCKKVPGKVGKLSDRGCTHAAGSPSESKFEWFPGPGPNNKFTAKGGASTLFETVNGYSSGCKSVAASGEYSPGANHKHLTASLVFTGCTVISSKEGVINGASCASRGSVAGEVVTEPLDGEVGWLNKAKNETALAFRAASGSGGITGLVDCGPYTFRVITGGAGMLVITRNDVMDKKEPLTFQQAAGFSCPGSGISANRTKRELVSTSWVQNCLRSPAARSR